MNQIKRIIKFSSSLWRLYVVIALFSILVAVLNQAAPLLTKSVIDAIVGGVGGGKIDQGWVATLVVLIFLSDVSATLLTNISGYYGDIMGVRLQKILAERYYQQLLRLPQSYFDNEITGAIINRLNRGAGEVGNFMNMFANNLLQFLLTTLFSLAIVAYYSWEVGLMLFALHPVVLWLTRRTSTVWMKEQEVINKNADIAGGRFTEVVSQIRVVKSFVREKAELSSLQSRYQKIINSRAKQSKHWHAQDIYRRLALNVIFFFVYAYVIWQTVRGAFSLGEMVLLIQYTAMVRMPILSMSFMVDSTQKAISNSRDYFSVMDIEPDAEADTSNRKLSVISGTVEYHQVSFNYTPKERVLNNVSFKIRPNSKVALVGESGEGKTTIAHLLLRLYEPDAGRIFIDDQDIRQVGLTSLRSKIGVVFQDSLLFSGTVKSNISYGNPVAKLSDIKKAAKDANAHGFISKLPKGYDTEIGEHGIRLSGGQKQRIAIARALLKDPPILILDEATSSLDSKSELEVQKALERLMEGRTTLIIAHRLSTIKDADQIIGIKKGRVAESGTPAQLAKKGGIYAELLELQTASISTKKRKLKQYEITA